MADAVPVSLLSARRGGCKPLRATMDPASYGLDVEPPGDALEAGTPRSGHLRQCVAAVTAQRPQLVTQAVEARF